MYSTSVDFRKARACLGKDLVCSVIHLDLFG